MRGSRKRDRNHLSFEETAVSTTFGGRSNGVRPSLSSAFGCTLPPPVPEPHANLMAPARPVNLSYQPEPCCLPRPRLLNPRRHWWAARPRLCCLCLLREKR